MEFGVKMARGVVHVQAKVPRKWMVVIVLNVAALVAHIISTEIKFRDVQRELADCRARIAAQAQQGSGQ